MIERLVILMMVFICETSLLIERHSQIIYKPKCWPFYILHFTWLGHKIYHVIWVYLYDNGRDGDNDDDEDHTNDIASQT